MKICSSIRRDCITLKEAKNGRFSTMSKGGKKVSQWVRSNRTPCNFTKKRGGLEAVSGEELPGNLQYLGKNMHWVLFSLKMHA